MVKQFDSNAGGQDEGRVLGFERRDAAIYRRRRTCCLNRFTSYTKADESDIVLSAEVVIGKCSKADFVERNRGVELY